MSSAQRPTIVIPSMPSHKAVSAGGVSVPAPRRIVSAIAALALSLSVTGAAASDRPTVRLERCEGPFGLECDARFCVKVRTEGWDRFPQGAVGTPDVHVRFSRMIRGEDGQTLPGHRFKVVLDVGSDHDRTLWFRTDDGPLLFEYVDFTASLESVSPSEEMSFDIATGKVAFRMSGNACRTYKNHPLLGW